MATREQHAARPSLGAVRFEGRAQPRDVHPQRLLLAGGLVAPQVVEDPISRHHPADVQQQQGEQGALLVGAEIDGSTAVQYLEGAEDAVLHHPTSTPLAPTYRRLNDRELQIKALVTIH